MKIFFSAGEPSGDVHGANLIRQLRERCPDIEAVGYGGPEMAQAGCVLLTDLTAYAVMWIARVIVNLHKFLALAGKADRYFRHHRPDAVVLIDYPGFNWWIARRAKAHGIPVFYFAPPQVWAWASWRVHKMRRLVDHVLCCLPFEARWFSERGCHATFVGHPFFDEVRRHQLDEAFVARHSNADTPLIAILPGSRTQEVVDNLKYFAKAAHRVRAAVPNVRFAVACFKPHHGQLARQALTENCLNAEVFVRRTPELIHLADCCLAVSGSVSLELLYHARPTVIQYWVSPLAFRIQKWFRRVRYITLVNLLACDDVFVTAASSASTNAPHPEQALFPEYLTCGDRSESMAADVIGWLKDRDSRAKVVDRLEKLRDEVGHGGATSVTADYILAELAKRTRPALQTHWISPRSVPAPRDGASVQRPHFSASRADAAAGQV